ncbi:unnamed protein product, partial [Adineta ricciae]
RESATERSMAAVCGPMIRGLMDPLMSYSGGLRNVKQIQHSILH